MSNKETARFLKIVVWYCIILMTLVIVACYIAAWHGVNTDHILTTSGLIFGGELIVSAVLRLSENLKRATESTEKPATKSVKSNEKLTGNA